MQNPESQWFGEQNVTSEEKTRLVRGVFDNVADKYDLMNDVMSGGVHRIWKDHFVRKIRPKAGLQYLDVAGGTGDIAFRIRKKAGENSRITICDLNEDMLNVGRNRALDRGYTDGLTWITGNAESLPVPDNTIDIYTIAFGLRNVTYIDTALQEAARVLKPGGRFYCLEFSHVHVPFLRQAYDAYSYAMIPRLGGLIAQDRESYQYLVESIRKFPKQKQLIKRMQDAGLTRCGYENLSFGIAAIHTGLKT